ncbi:MAG: lipopolysaccharide biosynthesis protein [Melioribacteraceae bacterium]|nr:MAG: lipopolysaccharide biosynthesis protein [Melioribacteraceae bacterium]
MSLVKAGISGIGWNTSSRVLRQLVQIINYLILTSLLDPGAFGLIGMAVVVTGFLTVFRDMGISFALIQRKEISHKLFSSAFWFNISFALLLIALLNLSAPLIADFNNEPELTLVLRVLSLSIFLTSLTILQQALFEKELNFKYVATYEILAAISGAVVGISMAFMGYGVWSIVAQYLTANFLTSLFLWFGSKWKPAIEFSWEEVKDVMAFSLNSVGFNMLNYLVRNLDKLLIGKYLGKEAFGLYSVAYRILLLPLNNITSVFMRVMYPIFSKLQDDNEKLKEAYLITTLALSIITFPLMLGILGVSDVFVDLFLNEKWQPLKGLLVVFSVIGLIQSVFTQTGVLFQVKDKTNIWFRWGLFTAGTYGLSYVIGLNWGIMGVALAYLIANIVIIYPGLAIPFKYFDCKVSELFLNLKESILLSVGMMIFLFLIKYLLVGAVSNLVLFIILVISGAGFYILMSYIFNKHNLKKIYSLLQRARS